MELTVNGAVQSLPPATTLAELVAGMSALGRGLAVALNGAVVPRAQWADTALRPADRVEVLTATQGG